MSAKTETLVSIAARELGHVEDPRGSNRNIYGKWFGMDGVPWCAEFVSFCCATAGIPLRSASTVYMKQWAKKNGRWSATPRRGMVAMAQHSPTTGHVGIVEGVQANGSIVTIEGNTNGAGSREGDGTYRKVRRPGSWLGFIDLEGLGDDAPGNPASRPQGNRFASMPTLRRGAKGPDVIALQQALAAKGMAFPRFGLDGDFGREAEGAVLFFQRSQGLVADGIAGPQTWAALS